MNKYDENQSQNTKKSLQEKLVSFLGVICVLGIVLVNIMKILGCIRFSAFYMHDICFASIMFICMIIVYECKKIKESKKSFFLGVLCGSIIFLSEKYILMIALFLLNIFWSKILLGYEYRRIIKFIISILFYGFVFLEFYTVYALGNMYFYDEMMISFVFKLVDLFLLVFTVMYVWFEKKRKSMSFIRKDLLSEKEKYCMQIGRRCVWCVLIVAAVFISIVELWSIKDCVLNGVQFYFGKSIECGYLVIKELGNELLYYAKCWDVPVGGVIENMLSYELIPLEGYFSYQVGLLYIVRFMYYILYGIQGVITISIVSIGWLCYKINRNKYLILNTQ